MKYFELRGKKFQIENNLNPKPRNQNHLTVTANLERQGLMLCLYFVSYFDLEVQPDFSFVNVKQDL